MMRTFDPRPGAFVPRDALANKPKHGQPCNRCGLCCMATVCPLGQHLFGRQRGPCPALVKVVKRTNDPDWTGRDHWTETTEYQCGVANDPMKYSIRLTLLNNVEKMRAAALLLIGAATGCDARFNGEPPNEEFYDRLTEHDRKHRVEIREAKRLWGMRR